MAAHRLALVAAGLGAALAMLPAHSADRAVSTAADPQPAGDASGLTLSGEARLRYVNAQAGRLLPGGDVAQMQFRGVIGADWRVDSHLRFHGEAGTGQVDRERDVAPANFQNRAALQQLFVEVRGTQGPVLVGAMLGRQEFADGPRQLISLGDGPNLHRSWNGVRLYAHANRYRIGAFELRATRLSAGSFDDGIQSGMLLRGANASFLMPRGEATETSLDPFWYHTELPAFRLGAETGRDARDTLGLRLWGRKGALRYDWTLARQRGHSLGDRDIDAWAVFAVQSLALSGTGWKPRLTSHIDIASGGGLRNAGTLRNFHPLYASSSYLGESQFLGLSNLLLVAPGIALSPSTHTSLSFEYADARRLDTRDAAYAGGMRAYAGTADAPGRRIGGLLRLNGSWSASHHMTFDVTVEHLAAGRVLRAAGFGSGTHAQLGATWKY